MLGFSNGRGTGELHPVCIARLRRAEREARREDVVLLSGWARRRAAPSEAELMARSWRGPASRLLLDRNARSTVGNAVSAAAAARSVDAHEVVLVTSGWHGRRAAGLVRAALRDSGSSVSLALTDEPGSTRERVREAACWLVFPLQRAAARRRPSRPSAATR